MNTFILHQVAAQVYTQLLVKFSNRLKPYFVAQYLINHENEAGHGKM